MNSRDWVLVSTAAVLGALASSSALSFYFFFSAKRKRFPFSSTNSRRSSSNVVVFDSPSNGVDESREIESRALNPFDPSKRKGSVYLCFNFILIIIARNYSIN